MSQLNNNFWYSQTPGRQYNESSPSHFTHFLPTQPKLTLVSLAIMFHDGLYLVYSQGKCQRCFLQKKEIAPDTQQLVRAQILISNNILQ